MSIAVSKGAREASGARVAVVGGGLAGLTAALVCADAGAAVSLFEAKPWLGGATSSFERDGLLLDTGQHVFLRCCVAYRGLLERLGVTSKSWLQPALDIPVLAPGRRPARLGRSSLPPPLHLGPTLLRYPYLGWRDVAGVARAALAMRRLDPEDPSLDERTFGAWLAEHGQSAAAVRYLWDLFALPSLNLAAGEASLALAVKVFRTGLLDRADAADVGLSLEPLRELHGEPAARALAAAGADIRTGARVQAVERGAGPWLGVVVDDERVESDAVVVAVPNDRAAGLLPEGALRDPGAPGGLGASPIVNVHVVYDRRVMDERFVAAVDSPVQWAFDRSEAAGLAPRDGQYLAISLSGADDVADRPVAWFRETFVPALAALFPAAASARVERFLVTRERAATFRQAPLTARLRPGPATAVPGLFLAGAWTATGWPATMEGAVRSGVLAARRALAFLGTHERVREAVPA